MSATIVLLLLSTADLATGARLPQQQQGWVKCADKSTSLMKASQYCTCPGFVRYGDPLKNDGAGAWWTVDGKLVLVDARLHNGTILCDETLYFGRKDEMDGHVLHPKPDQKQRCCVYTTRTLSVRIDARKVDGGKGLHEQGESLE